MDLKAVEAAWKVAVLPLIQEQLNSPSPFWESMTRAPITFWRSRRPFEACPTLDIPHDYQDSVADPAPRTSNLEGRS